MALAMKAPWHPLKFTGTELPTQLLILVKVLALVVLLVNHVRILPVESLSTPAGWSPRRIIRRASEGREVSR